MKYVSVCSGICAATVAWKPLGWNPVAFSEIEPFPCSVLKHHYSDVPNLGDMTKFEEWDIEPGSIDVLVGGTPCFPADTMIAARCGMKPIQDIVVGDEVWTHKFRWQRVVRIGHKQSATICVKGQGHPGLRTTAEHPFLSVKKSHRSTSIKGKPISITSVSEPSWVAASDMKGKHWACVANWPVLPIPEVTLIGNESRQFKINESLMLLAGAYLGDGWCRISSRRGCVILGLNAEKLKKLEPTLNELGVFCSSHERTVIKVHIASRALARWLQENFGSGSAGKHIPMWALGMDRPLREALWRGYMLTDGGYDQKRDVWKVTTVSRQLAFTARMLAVSLGFASSVEFTIRPKTCVIESRVVNQQNTYKTTFSPSVRSSFESNGIRWQLVRSVVPTDNTETVYNIEVEEDHSYAADGIFVHNCQSFSIAGLRGGLEDGRGNLALTYCRILQKFKPRWFVWENVPGVLSSWSGDTPSSLGVSPGPGRTMDLEETSDFASIIGAFSELGYGVSGRVLDAQYFGVPQRRRRVFVIGYLGDWERAAEVLFEFGCLRGDTQKGGKKRKDVAGTLASRATAGGGLGTDFDLDGGLHVANPVTTMSGGQHLEQTLISSPLTTRPYADQLSDESKLVAYQCQGTNVGPMGTFRAGNGNETGGVPFVATPFAQNQLGEVRCGSVFNTLNTNSNASGRNTPMVHIATSTGNTSHCLNAGGMGRQDYETETMVVSSYRTAGDGAVYDSGDITAALTTGTDQCANIVAFGNVSDGSSIRNADSVSPPLTCRHGDPNSIASPSIGVRRLTPIECERLQGFPDNYTNVIHRGQPAADGNRYKSLGNSMAVPVMVWLGKRMEIVNARIQAEGIKTT